MCGQCVPTTEKERKRETVVAFSSCKGPALGSMIVGSLNPEPIVESLDSPGYLPLPKPNPNCLQRFGRIGLGFRIQTA